VAVKDLRIPILFLEIAMADSNEFIAAVLAAAVATGFQADRDAVDSPANSDGHLQYHPEVFNSHRRAGNEFGSGHSTADSQIELENTSGETHYKMFFRYASGFPIRK
jgi:hypothetical protein